jgi:uncharacterized protein (DUF433 family)
VSSPATLPTPPAPIRVDEDGVVRIGSTRVTLDTLVRAFLDGCSPEEITSRYPSLDLAEVYAVIAHYLTHRAKIDAYLADRAAQADAIRRDIAARPAMVDVRERLLARRRLAS